MLSITAEDVESASVTNAAVKKCLCLACVLWTPCASVLNVPSSLRKKQSFMTSSLKCS